MKTRFLSLIALIAILIISNACKKHEEGPMFLLGSPSKKLIGLWELSSININGIDYSSVYKDSLNANFLIADYDGLYVSIVENASISSQLASSSLTLEDKSRKMNLNFKAQNSLIYNIQFLVELLPILFEENSWTILRLTSTEFKIKKVKGKDYVLDFIIIKD